MSTAKASRRQFLQAAAGLALAAGSPAAPRFSAPFAMSLAGMAALASQSTARAADTSGYRALVCLFMNGGNDSHNWVVPVDADGHAEYTAARSVLALPLNRLTPISTVTDPGGGRLYGMPTELQALRTLYERGRAAVVANVGTLVRPVTRADFLAGVGLPAKLFSHNDQASTWQSLMPEGARSGWGGRMGDILAASNGNPVFTAVSAGGNAVFLSGTTVSQYQVGAEGSIRIKALSKTSTLGSDSAPAALQRVLSSRAAPLMQSEYARVVKRSIAADLALSAALSGVEVAAIPPTPILLGDGSTVTLDQDPLARQLRMVSRIVGAQQALGMSRQVFMVSINGFDTHANQMRDQPALMSRVAQSIDYFMSSIEGLGMAERVTLFTASDFGRTLTTNGSGSDHGWGSHHFVVGAAVRGRDIYGRLPATALGTANDLGSGRLLPEISVSEYAATLGAWMGLSGSEIQTVLPGIENFARPSIGFL